MNGREKGVEADAAKYLRVKNRRIFSVVGDGDRIRVNSQRTKEYAADSDDEESPLQIAKDEHEPGFAIWTDCRPHDGVHGAARPVGQLVNTSQHVNGSHFGDPWELCP